MTVVLRRAGMLLALVALGACASVPQGSAVRDAEAREYRALPNWSTVYVYRPGPPGGRNDDSILLVNDRLIGGTLPGTFFRVDVRPGSNLLRGYAHDNGELRLDTQPGELYFVRLSAVNGFSRFSVVDAAAARREIERCCVLLENWRPGQRPLLR